MEHIKKWVDEVVLFLTSGATALSGAFVILNTYLQTIAFTISIIAGVCAVLSYFEKKKARNQDKAKEQ
jgi:precorrin-2 methylase